LAQPLASLHPPDTDERRWVEGIPARKKGLGLWWTVSGGPIMTNAEREVWERYLQSERERMLAAPPAPPRPVEPQTIHYTELPEDTSGGPLSREWNFYRREVGRMLAEGHEGRWVLIKGEEIVGIWDTEGEADAVRLERFLMQPVLMKRICTREPVLRGGGYHRPWR
jgi:hypothetical protein